MRIGIIGGGSIGLLIGAKLADAGAEVTIWTRTAEQSAAIADDGIRLWDEQGGERTVGVRSQQLSDAVLREADSGQLGPVDWYLLALKQTDLSEEALERIAGLVRLTPGRPALLCLQNGTGHLEKLAAAAAGEFAVYNAVTSIGAKREDIRSVRHTGQGQLFISDQAEGTGVDAANTEPANSAENGMEAFPTAAVRQKMLLQSLIRAGFDASLSNDIHNRVCQKLLVNAVINPLTALFNVRNGELPAHPVRLSLMKALHAETESVLRAAGMDEREDSWQGVLSVCERTSLNVSSMLADVRAGRRTEIASINGEIVRLAAASGLQAPLNESILRLVETIGSELRNRAGDG